MKKVVSYCKRKEWFEQELERRTAPKPIKPEPTKQEIQQEKIAKAERKIKRYETKVKMYQKKLGKTKRSLSMLKKRHISI
jgi:predicted RNase H-like nuclease (RuvC/YqgF family)